MPAAGRISGRERDKGLPAVAIPAFMLFINHGPTARRNRRVHCVVGIERHGLEQNAVGLLPLPVAEMCSLGLSLLLRTFRC
jgi:hypothetical protein